MYEYKNASFGYLIFMEYEYNNQKLIPNVYKLALVCFDYNLMV